MQVAVPGPDGSLEKRELPRSAAHRAAQGLPEFCGGTGQLETGDRLAPPPGPFGFPFHTLSFRLCSFQFERTGRFAPAPPHLDLEPTFQTGGFKTEDPALLKVDDGWKVGGNLCNVS